MMRGSLQGPAELLRGAVHAVLPGARQAAGALQLLMCAVLGTPPAAAWARS